MENNIEIQMDAINDSVEDDQIDSTFDEESMDQLPNSSSNDAIVDEETNSNNNDDETIQTRKSLRPSTVNKAAKTSQNETKQKKGIKRKSNSNNDSSPNKLKIPKYEEIPIELKTKTIIISENMSKNYIMDRLKLTKIPPKEGQYGVGDLIWAKMQGYPWWPCMITNDPVTGDFSKTSGTSYKANIVYHVQYFGNQPYRGWTNIGMVMPFRGYQDFVNKIMEEIKDLDPKKRAKVEAKYVVKNSIQKNWNESVAEAEKALELSLENRVKLLTFNYSVNGEIVKTPRSSNKTPKKSLNNSTSSSSKKNSEDVYDFDEDEDDAFGEEAMQGFVFRKRNAKGDFNIYVKKHYDEEAKKNPDLKKSEIIKILKDRWAELDESLRAIYAERKAIYEDESNMLVSKRSNFGDDYSNSDSDYNDSDVPEHNGFDDSNSESNAENDNGVVDKPSSSNAKPRKSKSKKSEKLFDKIKNETTIADVKEEKSEKKEKSNNKPVKSKTKKSDLNNENETPVSNEESDENDKKSVNKSNKRKSMEDNDKNDQSPIKNLNSRLASFESDDSNDQLLKSKDKKVPIVEKFCFQCSDETKLNDILVTCSGECGRMYHLTCNKDTKMLLIDGKNICEECYTGKHKCFACKNPDDFETKKCEDSKCNYYYHLACLQNFPYRVNESANTFICPLHQCISCHLNTLEDNCHRDNNRKLARCIRCPIAYHRQPVCIGAGTVKITNSYIICPDHHRDLRNDKEKKDHRKKSLHNSDYCFTCIRGGNLVCCETCPASFHHGCTEIIYDYGGRFYCNNCMMRKQLHYGDIVWVKLGQFRWWPGRICGPNDVPTNILNLKHKIGDFPIFFFGSHNYCWVNKGNTFIFEEDDKKTKPKRLSGKSLDKSFLKAIQEASEAFDEWQKICAMNSSQTISKKPPPYQFINSNRYFSKKVSNSDSNDLNSHVCDCKKDVEKPCSDESCLNRISLIECDPKDCPAGEKCKNQRFRKAEWVKCQPFRDGLAGWGLQTLQDIKKDDFIIEYCGEIIDEKEYQKRIAGNLSGNFYFLTIDKDNIIDAGPKGNFARFMNHSCDPNCVTQKWMVNNTIRVGLFALKDIPAGSELTFNYNLDSRGNEQIKCKCKAANCSGYIGSKIGSNSKSENNSSQQNKRLTNGSSNKRNGNRISKSNSNNSNNHNNNSKKQKTNHKIDDDMLHADTEVNDNMDVCFKCGEKDNLITCNELECKKSYHLACINLTTMPVELVDGNNKWICPRHSCMNKPCSEKAFIFCSICPNSLCEQHATLSNSLQLPDNKFLCGDHRNNSDDEGLIEED